MDDAIAISASGLAVERLRLGLIAQNLANAETTRTPGGGPYQRRVAIVRPEAPAFARLLGDLRAPGGARVAAVVPVPATRRVYAPEHPDANAEGYVAYPDINPITELLDLMQAVRAYEANAAAIQAAKQMAQRTLELAR